jgi:hypothetical protein
VRKLSYRQIGVFILVGLTLGAAAITVGVRAQSQAPAQPANTACVCASTPLAQNPNSAIYNCVCTGKQCVAVVAGSTGGGAGQPSSASSAVSCIP